MATLIEWFATNLALVIFRRSDGRLLLFVKTVLNIYYLLNIPNFETILNEVKYMYIWSWYFLRKRSFTFQSFKVSPRVLYIRRVALKSTIKRTKGGLRDPAVLRVSRTHNNNINFSYCIIQYTFIPICFCFGEWKFRWWQ